jgi:hypothetical protein
MLTFIKAILLAAVTMTLAACGGGGGSDGGGFLPDNDTTVPLAITTATLPDVSQLPYATVLEASGGSGVYEWTLVSDGGTGFTLDAAGVLRANAAIAEGRYGLTFRVEDSRGRVVERSLTLFVSVQPLTITTTALAEADNGVPYSAVVEAAGGSTPYTWSLVDDGNTGFSFSNAGVLSGTPAGLGSYGLTFSVSDNAATEVAKSLILSVTGAVPQPLQVATTALPQVAEGERYSAVLAAIGGTGNYSWNLVFNGGTGFSLTSDGVLTGRAPSKGVYGLTFRVNDGNTTALRSLTVTVTGNDSPLLIETAALPDGTVDTRYAAVITATGGTTDYTWSLLDAGGSGLSLSGSGVLSGLPLDSGVFGLTVSVDDGEMTDVRSLTVSIALSDEPEPLPLAITTAALSDTTSNTRYAAILDASGGAGGYTWALLEDGGSGLTLSSSGVLSGTAPAPGSYGLSVEVRDSANARDVRSLVLTVTGDGPQTLVISSQSLPNGTVGTQYAAVLTATGGTGNYVWTLVNGGGAGLTLDAAGVLRGTPTASGNFALTVSVSDGISSVSRSLTVSIVGDEPTPLGITTTGLPGATTGTLYAAVVTATGGSGNYSWTLDRAGGSGLALGSDGVFSGTAPAVGDYGLTVSVDDGVTTLRRSFVLSVTGSGPQPLQVTTASLPSTSSGALYAAVITATGGASSSYTWTLLNDGGSGLEVVNNVLRGIAPAPGLYGLTLQVSDGTSTIRQSFTLTVTDSVDAPLAIASASLPAAVVNTRYVTVLQAAGGTGNYSWQLLSNDSSGLQLNGDGILSGTVASTGSYGLTVRVSDGDTSVTRSFTLTVNAGGAQALAITDTQLPGAEPGELYAAVLSATGGTGDYSWTLANGGGAGLTLDSDGVLRGTAPASGNYALTVRVNDGNNTVSRSLTLTVVGADPIPLAITTTGLPGATTGTLYAAVVTATGGSGNYSWTLDRAGGSGLALGSDGVFSGTAPAVGDYGLTVSVDDGVTTLRRSFVLSVTGSGPQPLQVTTASLPSTSSGALYAAVITATGGASSSYTWTLLNDGGSGLEVVNNVLRGIAPAPGLYGLTLQVSDGTSTIRQSFTLTVTDSVDAPLAIASASLPAAVVNTRYVTVLQAAGGTGNYSWQLLANDSSGLQLNGDGILSGTVTSTGSYGLTVRVSDGDTSVTRSFTLTVNAGGAQGPGHHRYTAAGCRAW